MVKTAKARGDVTPLGNLEEARVHDVIGYQVAQASIATVAAFQRSVGEPLELRPVEYTILALIDENPGVTGARLARALAVTPPNITTWLDKLDKRGLIAREAGTTDRRSQHVKTTKKGSTLVAEATRRLLLQDRELFSNLSAAERAMLVELLHKVALRRGP